MRPIPSPAISAPGWALAAWPGLLLVFLARLQFSSWPPEVTSWTDRVQAARPNIAAQLLLAMALFGFTAALRWDRLTPRLLLTLAMVTGPAPAVLLPFAVLGAAWLPVCLAWGGEQAVATMAGQALVYFSIGAIRRLRLPEKHKVV